MSKITMQQQPKTKKLDKAFKEFLKWCRVKNLSSYTLTYYEGCFNKFTSFFKSNTIKNITPKVIQDYILYLQQQNMTSISIRTYTRGLRAILRYFMDLGYMKNFKITLPKAEKKVKETYSNEELKLLLKKPNIKTCNFNTYRTWVVINYLLGTGNRVRTVVNIRNNDIDFANGYIRLTATKNKKQQLIPLSNTLKKVLQEYIRYRGGTDNDYLFCNEYGNRLTTNALQTSVRRYNLKRGVHKTSCHLFRHTFAKKWILSGGDIFRLQKILGHSSMEIVREYVNMFSADLKNNFDKFNPLEQMQNQKTNKAVIRMH